VVYPAAALATRYNRHAYLAEVNLEQTILSYRGDCVVRGKAADVLPRIADALL